MALLVTITDECQEDIRNHSIQKEVNLFKNRLLESQRTSFFDNFPPPYLKKRFKRQLRLIASEQRVGDDIVIVFCRILVRGQGEYGKFLEAPKDYGDKYFAPLISHDKLQELIEQFKTEANFIKKNELSESESNFLWSLVGREDAYIGDYFVYESYKWMQSVQDENIQKRLIKIPSVLISVIDKNLEVKSMPVDSNFDIVFNLVPQEKILLLVDIIQKKDHNTDDLKELCNLSDRESINQLSGRSYPSIFLSDEDIWIDIENNKEANIALSPEETDLLRSVHAEGENTGFPLFINGRAGSGKSTILQYLFNDYLKTFLMLETMDLRPPIYLTYSESLVKKSKSIVQSLSTKNYKDIESPIKLEESILNESIQQFKRFLLSKVPHDQKKRFSNDNYIDYSTFRKMWSDHFFQDPSALKKYNPDLSWHIIRSYIKGLSIDGFLEKEEYLELPKHEITVTPETFNLVYEKVWNSWYKLLCDESYWDDQDLVRFLLEEDLIKPEYPAIFCDEAQDFTRIELELLLRLNVYTERFIDSSILKKVPFAFAGDPFQTLNPTGFRWEAIKSIYVEKFILSLSPEQRFGNPELNYQELTFNYRSSENIVKLCNNVNLLRTIFFDHHNLKPQSTWHIEKNPPLPLMFNINTPNIKDVVKEQVDLTIIVPCMEGEEIDFVKKDNFLKSVVEIDEYGVPQNVFSPIRAKGLEFQRVLIYGFGKYYNEEFNVKDKSLDYYKNLPNEQKIALEYLINQLYVALSRAQRRLFIIDDSSGLEKFWFFANNPTFIEGLPGQVRNSFLWESQIGGVVQGTEQSWKEDKEDPIVRALQFEEEGKIKRDPYFLRQAALTYKSVNKLDKDIECRALALEFENELSKSGALYIQCHQYEKALEVLWKGENFSAIDKMIVENDAARNLVPRLEVKISTLISSSEAGTAITGLLTEIVDHIGTTDSERNLWSAAVNQLLKKLIKQNVHKGLDEWSEILHTLEKLNDRLKISLDYLAEIAIKANEGEKAVQYFEKVGDISSAKYKNAKIVLLKSKFTENPKGILAKDLSLLGNHFIESGNFADAIEVYGNSKLHKNIFEILQTKSLTDEETKNGLHKYIDVLAEENRWLDLVGLFNKKVFKRKTLTIFKSNREEFLFWFLKHLITSAYFVNSDNKIKEKVSDFLKEEFIIKEVSSWGNSFHPEFIGAAIERSGRDIDSLQYYENIQANSEGLIKEHAAIRWICVKYRQAKREEENGLAERAQKHKSEATKKEKTLNIKDIDSQPEFPFVTEFMRFPFESYKEKGAKTKTTAESRKVYTIKDDDEIENITPANEKVQKTYIDDLSFTLGTKNVKINRKINRINIEDINTLQNISVLVNERQCKSVDFEFDEFEGISYCKTFGISISFKDSECVSINFEEYGLSIDVS